MTISHPIAVLAPLLLLGLAWPTTRPAPATPVAEAAPHTVPAGLVRWHADFAAARAAACTSGRPVLLFHLLGRLDEEFC